jgi:hypothetical protein
MVALMVAMTYPVRHNEQYPWGRVGLEHDPEKLQTVRDEIVLKIKDVRALSDSTETIAL